ncbi:MAG: nuclear transport factor 2 family protein, partial [Patescibacteria group bacterium]
MKDTEIWLNYFAKYWKEKDIDKILSLFAGDVEYFETPKKKLDGKDAIKKEWVPIRQQGDISLRFNILKIAVEGNEVEWDLSFTDKKGVNHSYCGLYTIKLNDA